MKIFNTSYARITTGVLLVFICCAQQAQAQVKVASVRGTVRNNSGEAIANVSVMAKNTSSDFISGAQTDSNGAFRISGLPAEGQYSFTFSIIGYATQTLSGYSLKANETTSLNVRLQNLSKELDQVVVIGYGTVKKRDLTGSVTSVDGDELRQFSTATVTHALQGRSSGVVVTQNSGVPGANMQVRIRGANSIIGSNEPLWIIDGFPGDQNMLNANDIESMEVLKDASATAIYGSRGANGVIIITTKRGKAGKTKVVYEGSLGIQTARKKLDLLNAKEYMELMNIQQVNDNGAAYFSQADINGATNHDWQDFLFQKAPLHNHSLDISGGNNKTKFSINGSYYSQNGILRGNNYERINIRGNIDHTINDKLSVQYNTILNKSTSTNAYSSGTGLRGNTLLSSFVGAPPTLPPYNDDGSYRLLDIAYPFSSDGLINPIAYKNEVSDKWAAERVMSNFSFVYKPINDLVFRASGNITSTNGRTDEYTSLKYPSSIGTAAISVSKGFEWNTSILADYSKNIGKDHRLSATIGNTMDSYKSIPVSMSSRGFLSDVYETYNIGSGSIINTPSSNFSDWRLVSYLGRINYAFKDRLLLTASMRSDGSSRYSDNYKWGYFPSAAIAYRLSDESFIKNLNVFDNLKLRLSYGKTGSTAIPPYYTLNLLSSNKVVFNDVLFTAFAPGTRLPADLKWETTGQINAGIDMALFGNRLQFVMDYYEKNTYDLLNNVQLPRSLGYQTTVQNVGKIQNRGFELAINAKVLNGPVTWDVNGNFSTSKSKVVKLQKGQDILGRQLGITIINDNLTMLREGQPFGMFYGYKEDGYDENGKIKYKDIDGNGRITTADKTFIGDPNPKFTFGLNSSMAYKGFDLSFFLQGVSGNEIYSLSMAAQTMDFGFGLNTLREVLYDHWTSDHTDAKYPKISRTSSTLMSDRYVYDGSYLRLKNIQLGYNIDFQKLGLLNSETRAYIYISGQNQITLSSYPWFDPEANSLGGAASINQGIDWYTYPTAKSWTIGIRVNF